VGIVGIQSEIQIRSPTERNRKSLAGSIRVKNRYFRLKV
jgi:hypothetical protein